MSPSSPRPVVAASSSSASAPAIGPDFHEGIARTDLLLIADPRSKLLLAVACNVLVLGRGPALVLTVAAALSALLLADALRDRRAVWFTLVLSLCLGAYSALPHVWTSSTGIGVAITGMWFGRFLTSMGMAAWLVTTTSSGEFLAGLRALRTPGFVVLPVAVVLRFIPTIIRELHAIIDAMRLRGAVPSAGSILLHPAITAEHVLVPLLAMTTRMSDELSAAALIRGLDRSGPRTSIIRLGFHPGDALVIALAIALVALHFSGLEAPWIRG